MCYKQQYMKNLIISALIALCSYSVSAQESLIAGIMDVAPVNITIGEEDQAKVDEYDQTVTEETAKLDEKLAKLGEDYAKGVTDLIQKFTSTMDKGEEQIIKNEKQRVETQTNALTFNLIRDKKAAVQGFKNVLTSGMRPLPRAVSKMKAKELEDIVEEYKDNMHTEFEANKRVLRAFKATEHVTKTQYTGDMKPVESAEQ